MNITELRYLVAIMKWGSVSAAAKQMYAAHLFESFCHIDSFQGDLFAGQAECCREIHV